MGVLGPGAGYVVHPVPGLLGLIAVLHRVGVVWWPVHVLLGPGVWLATDASGIHATIAGVALDLLTPTRPWSGTCRSP
jgi:NhaA family Na+:H+ antiporter